MSVDYLRLDHKEDAYKDYFVVNWCLFSICQYSCSYCPTELHDGKVRGLPLETVSKFCLNLIKQKSDKKVFFEFTGGEVTYYKGFSELFKLLKANGAETGLISNGGRDLKFWEEHKHLIDHICLSFHPEQGDADHFYEVVRILNEVTTVHVNIMMLPEKFDELYKLSCRITSEIEGPSLAMQALFEGMSGKIFNYTPEQQGILNTQKLPWCENIIHRTQRVKKVYRGEMLKTLNDSSVEVANVPMLIAKNENAWKGWECHIGLENIVIDFHGNILRGWCRVGGIIGNVADAHFQAPIKPITCSAMKCHCGLDIMATKIKI